MATEVTEVSPAPRAVEPSPDSFDVVVVGAGFAGLYALHRLRQAGLKVRVYDRAAGVGGTWWWNRYPGARVDFLGGPFYCYTFSEEIVREWKWAETQPDRAAIVEYLNFVADRLDLRRDIQLNTTVEAPHFESNDHRWHLSLSDGSQVSCRFLVCAVGTLSDPYEPNLPGLENFTGDRFHTGRWPQDHEVSFEGKRVGIIGTGSSAVQAIPIIAETADRLTVFQRTPQFTIPAGNQPMPPALLADAQHNWARMRAEMLTSTAGAPLAYGERSQRSARSDSPETRRAVYESLWDSGGARIVFSSYNDLFLDVEANESIAEFIRAKIRATVTDPETAEKLMPDHLFGTKRVILNTNYYETFNQPNVELVDLRSEPIQTFEANAVRNERAAYPIDMLIMATGYDAMTGALRRLNPSAGASVQLRNRWADRVRTYLGIAVAGLPNLFLVHGPQSPSVLYNMPLGAERQLDWITECILAMNERGIDEIEPTTSAEDEWAAVVKATADYTLYPRTDSWYMGANIPGKPREFMVYLDALQYYRTLAEVAATDYAGFELR
jgi:cyclohexanone monooxygenase